MGIKVRNTGNTTNPQHNINQPTTRNTAPSSAGDTTPASTITDLQDSIHNEKIIRFNLGSTSFWLVDNPNFPFFLIKTPVIAHSRAPRDTSTDGCIEGYLNWTLGYQKSKKVTITHSHSDKKAANTPTWRSNSEWEWCILKEPQRRSGPEFVHGI